MGKRVVKRKTEVPPPAGPAPVAKTRTLPDSLRGADYEGPDVPTAIQIYNTDVEFELPRTSGTFTLGSSPDCAISIRDEYVSGLHCVLERRGQQLRVYDQHTKNGTFFDGRRLDVFDPRPGDTFTAGRMRLLLLNDVMRAGYAVLADVLGPVDASALGRSSMGLSSPCDLIVAAKEGANLLITGEPGCDQERIADTIHAISLRRGRDLVRLDTEPRERAEQRAVLDRASRSTLVLSISKDTPVMDASFVSMLFSPSYHIRVIVSAPNVAKALDVLGALHVNTMREVAVAPLAQRPGAIPRLLDRMFAERAASIRLSDLTPHNQDALMSYGWPKNMTALRTAADRLPVIANAPSLNAAAQALGMSQSSLQHWFADQLDLSWPLVQTG